MCHSPAVTAKRKIHRSSRQTCSRPPNPRHPYILTGGGIKVSKQAQTLTEDVVDDVRLVVEDLVDNHSEDAHLRSTAVVELNCALLELGLLGEGFPLLLEGVNARHITREGALLLLHHEELEEADEDHDLGYAKAAHLQPCEKRDEALRGAALHWKTPYKNTTLGMKYTALLGVRSCFWTVHQIKPQPSQNIT